MSVCIVLDQIPREKRNADIIVSTKRAHMGGGEWQTIATTSVSPTDMIQSQSPYCTKPNQGIVPTLKPSGLINYILHEAIVHDNFACYIEHKEKLTKEEIQLVQDHYMSYLTNTISATGSIDTNS